MPTPKHMCDLVVSNPSIHGAYSDMVGKLVDCERDDRARAGDCVLL